MLFLIQSLHLYFYNFNCIYTSTLISVIKLENFIKLNKLYLKFDGINNIFIQNKTCKSIHIDTKINGLQIDTIKIFNYNKNIY